MKLGDTVYLKAVGNNARRNKEVEVRESKITKWGRKYFEVSADCGYPTAVKFEIENKRQVTNFSPSWSLYENMQQILDEQECTKLNAIISEHFSIWNRNKLTLQQLRDISKIIGEPHD